MSSCLRFLRRFLIPEWHLSGAQAGPAGGLGRCRLHADGAGAGDADRPYRCAQDSDRGLGGQRARHRCCSACSPTGLWSGALFNAIAGIGFAGAYMPGLKALTDRLAPGDSSRARHALHVELFVRRRRCRFWCPNSSRKPRLARRVLRHRRRAAGDAHASARCCDRSSQTPASGRLLDFAPVLRNRSAMGFVLGYGAHCFELYGIRTWIVAFWTFVSLRIGRFGSDADRGQRSCSRCWRCPRAFSAMNCAEVRPASRHHRP